MQYFESLTYIKWTYLNCLKNTHLSLTHILTRLITFSIYFLVTKGCPKITMICFNRWGQDILAQQMGEKKCDFSRPKEQLVKYLILT